MSESTKFDLSTSEGGRGYLENLFQTQLKRHDFTSYIRVELAADFACALSQYIAPALAREAALREELAGLHEELSEEFAGEERTPETLQEAIAWLKTARDDNKSRWLSATERLKLQGITIRVVADREAALRRQLHDAATSLETISKQAGRDEFLKHMSQVCGYANSRATVARAFMDAQQVEEVARSCRWSSDEAGIWNSGCGVTWSFHEDGPEENSMSFCHSCGNPLVVETTAEADSDE